MFELHVSAALVLPTGVKYVTRFFPGDVNMKNMTEIKSKN